MCIVSVGNARLAVGGWTGGSVLFCGVGWHGDVDNCVAVLLLRVCVHRGTAMLPHGAVAVVGATRLYFVLLLQLGGMVWSWG